MGRASSQWDFGELFDGKELKKTYSVGELTGSIRKMLEGRFSRVRVSGEVSNFRAQSSGHFYFALKDSNAQLSCVLFRGERIAHRAAIDNGVQLILEGDLTVYEPRGQYQMIVRSVELHGVGALQLAFERLKNKLEGEGLFSAERKRPIPQYLFRLGVVTSVTAAALRDVLHVVQRRSLSTEMVLCSCRVQGQGAAEEIAAGIECLNRYAATMSSDQRLGAILVTRGGGSLEDLWAFNEEIVARAIAASPIPVISAVGHEVDFTISDFVADLRAPTPSAAAELLTEGVFSSRESIHLAAEALNGVVRRQLSHRAAIVNHVGRRLSSLHPRRSIEIYRQRMDDLEMVMGRASNDKRNRGYLLVHQLARQLSVYRPAAMVNQRRERIQQLTELLAERVCRNESQRRSTLDRISVTLRLLSPLNVLERGYSITRDETSGQIVTSIKEVTDGDHIITMLKDGELLSEVKSPKDDG